MKQDQVLNEFRIKEELGKFTVEVKCFKTVRFGLFGLRQKQIAYWGKASMRGNEATCVYLRGRFIFNEDPAPEQYSLAEAKSLIEIIKCGGRYHYV